MIVLHYLVSHNFSRTVTAFRRCVLQPLLSLFALHNGEIAKEAVLQGRKGAAEACAKHTSGHPAFIDNHS